MNIKQKRIGYFFLVLYVIMTCFIFFNSSRNASISTEQSSVFVSLVNGMIGLFGAKADIDTVTFIVRKLAHFSEFTVHAICLGLFFLLTEKHFYNRIIYILFAGLFTACTDEFIQLFPIGRSSQVSDVFVDFGGTVMGTLICIFIFVIIKRQEKGV